MVDDVSAEIRVKACLSQLGLELLRSFGGFNSVRGIGDVNGDSDFDINDNTGDLIVKRREPLVFDCMLVRNGMVKYHFCLISNRSLEKYK